MVVTIEWGAVARAAADAHDGSLVELVGYMAPVEPAENHSHFLLLSEPPCCIGCWPGDPLAAVEVIAARPLPTEGQALRLAGRWALVGDDPTGWRYQLRDARLVAIVPPAPVQLTRRSLFAAGAALGLAACAPAGPAPAPAAAADTPVDLAGTTTADLHSHAGRVMLRRDNNERPFTPLAEPMRAGGMAVVALAIVSDTPTHHVEGGRIRPFRSPEPGELYAWSTRAFARAHQLVAEQGLGIVTDRASLDAASGARPAVVIAAEGADFLEGVVDRVDEAYDRHQLRHLQLTHYRVNELGDIQTEPPVHGGLTDFGADVVRRCNARGLVVDVAHGTYELVKRAAAVTTKPLVLSHTSLSDRPGAFSRTISPDHARVIAGTGGVIGIWPPVTRFPDLPSLAQGMARMVDVVGVDHVGLGSDMLGLLSAASFADYDQLPALAKALRQAGFRPDEIGRILGGNYARVFRASMVA